MLIIKKIQTAIFINGFFIAGEYEKSKILLELKEEIGSTFNGNPVLIPVPNDAPGEIPRIIINSSDNLFATNIATSRIDVFSNLDKNTNENNVDLFEDHKINSLKLFSFIKKYSPSIIVNRIGLSIMCECAQEDAINFVKMNFFKESKINDFKELSCRYNKSSKLIDNISNIKFNNITEISAKDDKAVIFMADINTVAEKISDYDFSNDTFEKIMDHAINSEKDLINRFPKIYV